MKQIARNIGYSFIAAWVYILFNGVLLFPAIEPTAFVSSTHIVSSLSTGLAGLVLALLSVKLFSLERHREIVYLAGIVGAAGTWQERLICQGRQATVFSLAVFTCLGAGLCLVISALPFEIALPIASVLPVLAAFFLLVKPVQQEDGAHGSRGVESMGSDDAPVITIGDSFLHAPVRLFAVIALMSFAYG